MKIEKIIVEKKLYFLNRKDEIRKILFDANDCKIWAFQKALRKAEFYHQLLQRSKVFILPFLIYRRRKNNLGRKLGFDIPEGVFDEGLRIYHIGPISVNPAAKVGCNCVIVGNCCIGNVKGQRIAPTIGDNVMIGWGASLIGDLTIANGCQIGAGAVVTKSVESENTMVVGVPGKSRCLR